MAVETFDQRFKRLTSDLLMLDICRILNIEVRDLMKIRSGIRVPLNMERVRRLCLDNGLDFSSFTRDYDEPWSGELRTQVITSDAPAPTRRRSPDAAQKAARADTKQHIRFRADGSRVVESLPNTPPGEPTYSARLSELAVVSDSNENEEEQSLQQGSSVVGRLKAAVATAAAILIADPLTDGREERRSEPAEPENQDLNYPEPHKIGTTKWSSNDHMIVQTILSEVGDLRKDVHILTKRIDELIGR